MVKEKIKKTNRIQMPNLQINTDDVKPIGNYDSLELFLGKIIIVRNKLDPEKILVGTLIKKGDNYRVNGTSFKKAGKGCHHIIGNIYERDARAEYGLEAGEFEKRNPQCIHDVNKASSVNHDLEIISSLPHISFTHESDTRNL